MSQRPRRWIVYALLLLGAFAFRFYVAHRLANDTPGDGKVYAQMARNLLEQHVYSHDEAPPYAPSLIRLPGYPLFLATVYSIFGHYNNTAVRIIQALVDTLTCGLVALLAFYWEPQKELKRRAALIALILAAACPFTVIYVGTILTETWASFFAISLSLLATFAFRATSFKQSLWRWAATGFAGGVGVFFRPDSGLFVAAVGLTLVADLFRGGAGWRQRLRQIVMQGAVLSAAFLLLLIPWTIRNWRTFHLFQPLSPAHGEMPGEFVPRGYQAWVRTWINDGRYIETVLWTLDDKPLDVDEFPESAFDSPEEKARVTALLDQYNYPADTTGTEEQSPTEPASPSPIPTPASTPEDQAQSDEESDDEEQMTEVDEPQTPEMTPAIDAAFGQLARERIARARLRYYVRLPLQRAWSLWAGPHADYYPFSGELFPLDDLDHGIHQHIWLPLFMVLVWLYTLFGLAGGWVLWRARDVSSRRWLLLVALLILIRLAFFSTIENPEPRYTVEFFPFLAVLGGIAIARFRIWSAAAENIVIQASRS
jgi:Dolichyl-phosphate-mannose-protein mannosyltransferase